MKIFELEIKNIRGIKDLTLKPKGSNFVVWGMNGSGKSAVVDAIDFLMTGQMSRLTGAGTGEISIKKFGQHIDSTDPKESFVKAKIALPGVSEIIEISRTFQKPSEVNIDGKYLDQFKEIQNIAKRGENVLTRREILHFITSEGAKRAEEIQTLLDLSEVEQIRKLIVKVHGNFEKDSQKASIEVIKAKQQVCNRIGLKEFSDEGLQQKVNEFRAILGGLPITKINSDSIKNDLKPMQLNEVDKPPKYTAVYVNSVINNLKILGNEVFLLNQKNISEMLFAKICSIHEDANVLKSIRDQKLVELGISLLDNSGKCPLCEKQWDPDELSQFLTRKSAFSKVIEKELIEIKKIANSTKEILQSYKTSIEEIIRIFEYFNYGQVKEIFKSSNNKLEMYIDYLNDPILKYHEFKFDIEEVSRLFLPPSINEILEKSSEFVSGLVPSISPELETWDLLTKLSVDLTQLSGREKDNSDASLFFSRVVSLKTEFENSRDEILQNLYDEIKERFVNLYRELHSEDESKFTALLRPEGASLNFGVDFFGRGVYPPHAMHSEGHQDSMGLCLFLALEEKLTHGLIDLIILDDVVMSVDASHRRALCSMLVNNFPNKQFIITTHDKTWATQLLNNGVVNKNNLIEFFDWSVETGPHVNDLADLWSSIEKNLAANDIHSAAARLRRGAEQYFTDVCNNIFASVEFRSDGRYDLGELMGSAMSRLKELTKIANQVKKSWDKDSIDDTLLVFSEKRKAVFAKVANEQWAININVHFSEWEDFTKEDFIPVVNSYRELFQLFQCDYCGGMIKVLREGKNLQNVRCNCDKLNWNLVQNKDK